jgi:glycosyltransferase involved in cell wall biosynthesis
VNILVLVPEYPHLGHRFGGIFNERCATALTELCDAVVVLAPRPYAPPMLSLLVPRWKIYAQIPAYEVRNGLPVYRPAYLQLPRVGGAFSADPGAFLCCRRIARRINSRMRFDAILSFNLVSAGGLAWRIGRDLGIPASGWATGGDVRYPPNSSYGRAVIRALERLDVVFYQSHELLERAATLLDISSSEMLADEHIVLPRGIPAPPSLPRTEMRSRIRQAWGITDDQVLILSIGRICRAKGIFELLDAISAVIAKDPKITCVVIGSAPAFDETTAIQKKLAQTPGLTEHVRLLPACSPDKIWEFLCAADVFAFTSHHEGMPNSLLEAMAMGVPAVAFAIPAILEIENGSGGLIAVPPFDVMLFSKAILELAASPDNRIQIGQQGRAQVMDRFMVRKNMTHALERLSRLVMQCS